MTKEQILAGLKEGRTLIQEEWADYSEIQAVDALVADGYATATRWEWKPSYQCERRVVTAGAKAMS